MSEWKEGAARRRDERATKTDGTHRHVSRKNTRRWCKGKVGVQHVTEPVDWVAFHGTVYGYDKCVRCGKKVRHWTRENK